MPKKAKVEYTGTSLEGFILVNAEKLNRVIHGTVGREGGLTGGLGEKAAPGAILAAYDKLGGLIVKDGRRVKTGCFWDFEKKEAVEKPVVLFLFRDIEGNVVEVAEGEALPIEVQAAEQIAAGKSETGKKVRKSRKTVEEEE